MIVTGLYIVKNEENNIRRSIDSIKNICDELIVIDTGSTDHTVELVEALGAKVYHFEWVNDFSKARNFALSKAHGDLIIFIDADEWFPTPLTQDDRKYLLDLVQQDYRVFNVLRSDKHGDMFGVPNYNTRIYQGKKGLYYIGTIHESINDSKGTYYLPDRFLLHHSGYDADLGKEKVERNLSLLYDQLERETTPYRRMGMCFYIARENGILGNMSETLKYLDLLFDMWHKAKRSERPINVGILAYDLLTKSYSALPEQLASNDKYFKVCGDFLKDFPRHPVAHYAMANYYFMRHRDYDKAMEYIQNVERAVLAYNIKDYPYDYIGVGEPKNNAIMLKGHILFDRGQRSGAFDCYTSILRSATPTPEFLRRLLTLIKDQPASDAIAFLTYVPPKISVEYMEMLLSQVVFFPSMQEIYMYFAVQHLKLSKKQSDISAIAALLDDGSCDMLIEVAKQLLESDPLTAAELLSLAAIYSEDPEIRGSFPPFPFIDRVLDGYFSGVSPEAYSKEELMLIGRLFTKVLFVGDKAKTRRLFAIISEFKFIMAYLILHYCNKSREYGELIDLVDVDEEKLTPPNRAAFYMLMGRANIAMGDYDDAFSYLSEAFTLTPGDIAIYRELRTLASVSSAYAGEILSLIDKFRSVMGQGSVKDETLDSINKAFE